MRYLAHLIAGLTALAVIGLTACQPHTYTATLIDPPLEVPDFTLDTDDGGTFTLSDYDDRLVVLFFGYTNCPDICPATLLQLQRTVDMLGGDAGQIVVAVVTVDPERDSVERLDEYLGNFDDTFIGLRTDDSDHLLAIVESMGVYYEVETHDDHAETYLVAHTSSILVLKDRGLVAVFPPDTGADALAADLRALLSR